MSVELLLRGAVLLLLIAAGWPGVARAETVVSVTQFSYDDEERLQCTAVRMNPVIYSGALPDACTLGAQGSDGPDRITKNSYDVAGQLTQVQRAYGTPLQQANVTYTYSVTGKQTSVTDANGNKASLTYDGFDRLKQWNFPDKVTAGTVSATDYEAYGYDDDGNRISLRKRDGQTITYGYDALNRLTLKDVPGATDDVNYGYDLLGAQVSARFAPTGLGITNTFDALSRLTSTTNNMGATTRTLNYQYDQAGNRKQLIYPDSSYITYVYDAINRLTTIKEAGATAIVSNTYNAKGQLENQTRGGVAITLGYDGLSRPTSWNDNLAGTTDDVTSTFGYNPAGQIKTKTRTNTAYTFAGYIALNRPYLVNGLNQYTTAGSKTFGYDGNGNLTGDSTDVYNYDVENRMKTATVGGVGVTLNYDPLGRLWQVMTPAQTLELTHDGDSIAMEVSGGSLIKYVHGLGDDDPMIQYTAGGYGGRQSLQPDYQGSIVSVADANGAKVAINTYDDYGIGPSASVGLPPNVGRFQYTGQVWLAQLGLYYYKARMYSPTLGRFMQTDPIGYKDQFNLYVYVGNDPVNGRDPTGESSELVCRRVYLIGNHCFVVIKNDKGAVTDRFSYGPEKVTCATCDKGSLVETRDDPDSPTNKSDAETARTGRDQTASTNLNQFGVSDAQVRAAGQAEDKKLGTVDSPKGHKYNLWGNSSNTGAAAVVDGAKPGLSAEMNMGYGVTPGWPEPPPPPLYCGDVEEVGCGPD